MQSHPFDLNHHAVYREWRARKLAHLPAQLNDLMVDIEDVSVLSDTERVALLQRLSQYNMVIYRAAKPPQTSGDVVALAKQVGLHRLDANWLADTDGISRITDAARTGGARQRGEFIPYTDQAIGWHTDGYYHPAERRIHAMLLHCVVPAASGGVNRLVDPELLYIKLRDENPDWVRALMADDAMLIPQREDEDGVARAEVSGPVFSVHLDDAGVWRLHTRYTARTRSIRWASDACTQAAVQALKACLSSAESPIQTVHMQAGMGMIANNVLHDRSAFEDSAKGPARLLWRARYLHRAQGWQDEKELMCSG